MRKKLLAHANACVIHNKTKHCVIFRLMPLVRGKSDLSAFSRKFYGIAHNIDQNLLQLHRIPDIIIVQHRVHNAFIFHAFCRRLGKADGVYPAQEFLHRDLLIFQQHFSALDPAHIQDIVN